MDANSAALERYEVQKEEAARIHRFFEKKVKEELVDDIMNGWCEEITLASIIEDEFRARLAIADADTRLEIIDNMIETSEKKVREWLDSADAETINSDRCWEMNDDA